MDKTDRLVKLRDFSERTGVATENLRRWFHDDELRGVQPGGKNRGIYIYESEINRLLGNTGGRQ